MSFALAAGATAPHASNASAGIVNGRRRSGVTAALAPTGVKLSRGSVRFGGDARALLVRKGVPAKPVSRDVKAMGARVDPKDEWWLKTEKPPNMRDCNGTEEFLAALAEAGEDTLVVVDFYARWCGACRALYPKLCKIAAAEENLESCLFLKVEFDDNKEMCRNLGVKVLPYFHMYKGKKGRVAEFSASVTKVGRIRENLVQFREEGART